MGSRHVVSLCENSAKKNLKTSINEQKNIKKQSHETPYNIFTKNICHRSETCASGDNDPNENK